MHRGGARLEYLGWQEVVCYEWHTTKQWRLPNRVNQVKRLFTVMQTNGFNVGDKLIKPVALDAFRFRGLAVAAQVRYADSIPSVCKRFDLVVPSVPAFWKPMQQNDEFTFLWAKLTYL